MVYKKKRRQSSKKKYNRRSRKAVGLIGLFLLVIGSAGCMASKGSLTTLQETGKIEQIQKVSEEEPAQTDNTNNTNNNKNAALKDELQSEKATSAKPNKNSKKQEKEKENKTKENQTTQNQAKDNSSKNSKKSQATTDRVAFLGDSRTEGLALSCTYQEADFYAKCGICLNQIENKKNFLLKNGKRGNMLDALFQKDYDKIYLMFGLNELGWPYEEEFEKHYESIVNQIKEHYPNAKIYIQSILPIVESKGDKIFNNENIDKFNGYVKKVAKHTGTTYVDVASSMKKNGGLPEDASEDGIHLKRGYMEKWSAFLKENT